MIVDLDGVLVDTEPLYEKAFAAALNALGDATPLDFFQLTVGRRETDFLPDLALGLGRAATEIREALEKAINDALGSGIPPMPFASEAVGALRRDGRAIGVATSSRLASRSRLWSSSASRRGYARW